jgi:hypothetical protein
MPAAKLRPVMPSTTTVPPVMYSQPWSPTPSTTAVPPELRTRSVRHRPREEGFALGRTVHDGVADDDVLLGIATEIGIRLDDDAATRQALADVVVAFASQVEGDTAARKAPKAGRRCRSA